MAGLTWDLATSAVVTTMIFGFIATGVLVIDIALALWLYFFYRSFDDEDSG